MDELILIAALGLGAYLVFKNQGNPAAQPMTNMPMLPTGPGTLVNTTAPLPQSFAPVAPTPAPSPLVPMPGPSSPYPTQNPLVTSMGPVSAPVLPSLMPDTTPMPAPMPTSSNPIAPAPTIAPAPSPPMPSYYPVLNWSTNQGTGHSTSVIAGVTVSFLITGAAPFSQVVLNLGKNGLTQSIPIGSVDFNGNFQYQGMLDSSAYQWDLSFFVAGQNVGIVTFYVSSAPAIAVSSDPATTYYQPTSSGMPVPATTDQPGVITTASAPPSTIQVAPTTTTFTGYNPYGSYNPVGTIWT